MSVASCLWLPSRDLVHSRLDFGSVSVASRCLPLLLPPAGPWWRRFRLRRRCLPLPPVASRCFCLLLVPLASLSAPSPLPPVASRCFCLPLVAVTQLSAPWPLPSVASRCLPLILPPAGSSRLAFGSVAVASHCFCSICFGAARASVSPTFHGSMKS